MVRIYRGMNMILKRFRLFGIIVFSLALLFNLGCNSKAVKKAQANYTKCGTGNFNACFQYGNYLAKKVRIQNLQSLILKRLVMEV